jgi:hypothetical protein
VTRLRAGLPENRRFQAGAGILLLISCLGRLCGPAANYSVGNGALSHWDKRPGSETDHLHLSSAAVKNRWICISIPSLVIMGRCVINARRNLYF